jgi:hypothetical protein
MQAEKKKKFRCISILFLHILFVTGGTDEGGHGDVAQEYADGP